MSLLVGLRRAFLKRGECISVIFREVHRKKTEKVVAVGSSYSVVYKLPQISMCSLINKVKKYQLMFVGAGTPVTFGLHALQICDHSVPVTFLGVALASTTAIFAVGQLFTNLVGVAYISKDRSRVKISSLNFWGDRIDKVFDTTEVQGVTKESPWPWYRLHLANDPTNYKISLRYGEITTTPLFREALKFDPDADLPKS